MRLPFAQKLAERCVEVLQPVCERIAITGEVRLGLEIVNQITLVVTPIRHKVQINLFEEGWVIDPKFQELVDGWVKLKGEATEHKFSRWLPGFYTINIYVASEENWGVQMALSTGNFAFRKTLEEKWARKKWTCRKGTMYRKKNMTLIPIPEETDLFRELKMPYVHPENRNQELTDVQKRKLNFKR